MSNADNVDRLLADPRFGELLYLAKTNSDAFEVLRLTENQHSDMLQWMFNSREGHGLGDSVFKDFMIAIHNESGKLDGKYLTSSFRKYWTPARIRASSFSELYFFREMATSDGKNRVDLVIVDSVNRMIIIVENKTGSKVHSKQLERYYETITNSALAREYDYEVAFVLLDMYYDYDTEKNSDYSLWAELNYSWLESGAKRAEKEYMSGNHSVSFLMSYCKMVTGWHSEVGEELDKLSFSLNKDFPEEVDLFREHLNSVSAISFDSLKPFLKTLEENEERSQCIEIYHKYPTAIEWLIYPSAIDVLKHTLNQQFENIVEYEDECMYVSRKKLEFRLPIHFEIPTKNFWPLFVRFKYVEIENKYSMEFRWMKSRVIPEYYNSDRIDEIVNKLFESNPEFKEPIIGIGIKEAADKFGKLYRAFSGLSEE